MLEDRNRTSRLYDEQEARSIYDTIRSVYLLLLSDLPGAVRNVSS